MWNFTTLSLAVLAFFTGCSTGSEVGSGLQHTWGETTRGTPPEGAPLLCPFSDPSDPHVARLTQIAGRIAKHNPDTFKGALSFSQLCFGVNSSWNKPEARSTPETKSMMFSPTMVLVAQNDDELAAVLSHEMAHVTLQHQGFGEAPPRLVSDPLFAQLQNQGKAIQTEIARLANERGRAKEIFELTEKFGQLQTQMNARIDEVYGEKNAHASWFEQEADEVGGEFFLRSGYQQNSYISMLWRTSSATPEDYQRCQKLIDDALRAGGNGPRPERGDKVHPTTCWRAFHLKVDEWTYAHQKDLATLSR